VARAHSTCQLAALVAAEEAADEIERLRGVLLATDVGGGYESWAIYNTVEQALRVCRAAPEPSAGRAYDGQHSGCGGATYHIDNIWMACEKCG
jgi:hypothetical protein